MTDSPENVSLGPAAADAGAPDDVSVGRWFAFYGLYLLAAGVPLAILLAREPWSWSDWLERPWELLAAASPAAKLLALGIYISLCCTFLPLPTNPIVAAVALRQTVVAAAIGALASMTANLNDYHLFTWMLRHRWIRRVRRTRLYGVAAGWFARAPFFILVVFNIASVPVGVVRMLATAARYPRVPFAGANFLGRFVRYGVIAHVTYSLGPNGKWAVWALLALAAMLAVGKFLPAALRRIRPKAPNAAIGEVSTVEQRVPRRWE